MNLLDTYKNEIAMLCRSHHVKILYVFGSAVNGNFNANSDIDLMVTFNTMDLKNYFSNYLDLKEKLESVLSHRIDLLEAQTLKNPILVQSINRTKQLVYG